MMLLTIVLILNCWNLVADMKIFVLDLLEQDAIEMERWDPTEIIAVPFPEDNLQYLVFRCFVSSILISSVLYALEKRRPQKSTKMPKSSDSEVITTIVVDILRNTVSSTILQLLLAVVIFFLSILLGASPWKWLWHTVLASLYVSSLTFGFIQSKRCDVNPDVNVKSSEGSGAYIRLFLDPIVHIMIGPESPPLAGGVESTAVQNSEGSTSGFGSWTAFDQINRCVVYSVMIITVPFMILNILDHGDQIQRWPVPILLGSTVGHVVGVGFGVVSVWGSFGVRSVRRRMREKSRLA